MKRKLRLFGLCLVAILHATPCLPAQYQFKTIALSGDTAPGSGSSGADVPFNGFFDPVINASGEVAFGAVTSPNVDGGDSGIFSTVGGTLNAVAFDQQVAPGSGGPGTDVPFTGFFSPSLNASGEVAFVAVTSPNVDGGVAGIFSTIGGTLNALAILGQFAPGSGGSGADVPFTGFNAHRINASGEVAFGAATSPNGDGGDSGIFSTVGGTLHTLAFEQQVAPGSGGSGADVPFNNGLFAPVINASGEVAFVAATSPNVDGGDSGIFSTVGGTLHTVAFEHQVAPGSGGSGADVSFASFSPPGINATGEVAFVADTFPNAEGGDSGIFSTVGGMLNAVAFEQQVAPGSGGSGADVLFTQFPGSTGLGTGINGSGEVVFVALTTTNVDGGRAGIFSTVEGTLHAVAFQQQVAPGSGGSGADVPFSSFRRASMNASGEVAFFAGTLPNADGGSSGIFTDVGGSLRAVLFQGDKFEVSPGDFRVVRSLRFDFNNSSGQPWGINDSGELVFWAGFTDDSEGIFVWNLVAVPEPSTSILLCLGGLFFCTYRRRSHSSSRKVSS